MAKKRKLSVVSTSRSKDAKELKESSEELSQQSDVSETTADRPEKVSTAREHLKTVLQELLVISDESSDEPADDKEDKDAREKEEQESKLKDLKKEKLVEDKKKRRRTKSKEAQFHHTYVMKLFDRSVDLAQFKEETPLYPICRAWMENQPRNAGTKSRRYTSTNGDEEDEDEKRGKGAEGGSGVVGNTRKLPPPIPLPKDPEERRKFQIPSPIPYERSKEIDMDLEVKPSRETLLRAHVVRWTAIRKKWHKVGHKNEARFAASAEILRNIYGQAQSSFANMNNC